MGVLCLQIEQRLRCELGGESRRNWWYKSENWCGHRVGESAGPWAASTSDVGGNLVFFWCVNNKRDQLPVDPVSAGSVMSVDDWQPDGAGPFSGVTLEHGESFHFWMVHYRELAGWLRRKRWGINFNRQRKYPHRVPRPLYIWRVYLRLSSSILDQCLVLYHRTSALKPYVLFTAVRSVSLKWLQVIQDP